MPPELTGPQRRARRAFVARRPATALATADELEAAGLDADELDGLEAGGVVERWALGDDVHWTLTPLWAQRMGLEIEERAEGQPAWVKIEPGRRPRPVRLHGRPGERRLARAELVRAPESKAPDPEAVARTAECRRLLEWFEQTGDVEFLRKAEWIVPGVAAGMRARYLWDEALDRPRLLMGRLVRVDSRMGPGRAG